MSNSSPKKLRPPASTPSYTASGIYTAHGLSPLAASGGSNQKARLASTRALLRHQLSVDNSHLSVRRDGGLHPMYIALHGDGKAVGKDRQEIKQVLDESCKDLFDAVSSFFLHFSCFLTSITVQLAVLDRIDGGITVLMRCPGYQTSEDLTAENITVDLYISPRELHERGQQISERVAVLAQSFGEDMALPHLRRFAARCFIENVVPLQAPRKFLPF